MVKVVGVLVAILGGTTACRPPLSGSPGHIEAPRVLAVRAAPAEVAPGARTFLEALVVDEDGDVDSTVSGTAISWSRCTTPRAPGENGALPAACVDDTGATVVDDDDDEDHTITAAIPTDACATFGPEIGSGLRPRDADSTGGYHQPFRLDVVVDDVALQAAAFVRLACRLGDAPVEIAQRFAEARRDNQNPAGLVVDAPDVVGVGDPIDITAEWSAAAAETYLRYDRDAVRLIETREVLTASFFVTAGQLAAERLGAVDDATSVRNRWMAPDVAGVVHLWVVVRDGRGGTAWSRHTLTVE